MLPSRNAMKPELNLTLITTCKGRLHDLQKTLPIMIASTAREIVVVDYGCPQGTKDWLKDGFPEIKRVYVDDDPGFNLGRARNLGAEAATSDWLCFIDADIVLQPGWAEWVRNNLQPDCYYRVHQDAAPDRDGIWGTVICSREAFMRTGGYDVAITGYGGDDTDYYERLGVEGYRESPLPPQLLQCIDTPHEAKTTFTQVKDTQQSLKIGHLYRYIKYNIHAVLGRELNLPQRQRLYKYCRDAVLNNDIQKPFDLELRTNMHQHRAIVTCKLQYTITAMPDRPSPNPVDN